MEDHERVLILARFSALQIVVAYLLDQRLGPNMDARQAAENELAAAVLRGMEGASAPADWSAEMSEAYPHLLSEEVRAIFQLANGATRDSPAQQS